MIVIVMGVSGSGKTTIAKQLAKVTGASFRDGDDYHPEDNISAMKNGIALSDAMRKPWLAAMADDIAVFANQNKTLFLACSALKRNYRDILTSGIANTRLVYLRGTKNQITSRLENRKDHFFPISLLDNQLTTLQEPDKNENAIVVPVSASVDEAVKIIVAELEL